MVSSFQIQSCKKQNMQISAKAFSCQLHFFDFFFDIYATTIPSELSYTLEREVRDL